ncbi:MAG: YbaN family protein [Bacteroidaceae bacterium]|uniref:YbaN family protein n=1 Tax=Bacteroides ihuae TaxID=1852362 RepID=UPI0008D9ADB7|nr:YbaN family protein [Bacteroides ihuae]
MKTIYIIIGTISLILGVMGIFLPLLPTTPFLLLTAALYFRASPRLYNWLLSQKHLGPYIRNFREEKAIPLRAKIISITLMWATMLYSISFIVPLMWAKIVLLLIAIGVTYHILSYKTLKK